MFDYPAFETTATSVETRRSVLGKVLALLGIAFLCTAGGVFIGRLIGGPIFLIAIVGAIGSLIALMFLREKAPINLWLMYGFATFQGMALALILERYLAAGLGGAVLNAAVTTGVVTLGAGAYGYTTKRDLSGMGTILFVGLIALIVASLAGIFIQLPLLHLLIGAAGAVLFSAFLVFDLNRVANAREVTEGAIIMMAVAIYLDIYNLFLSLLRVFGFLSSDD